MENARFREQRPGIQREQGDTANGRY
jgi:hypothetical protein